MTMTLESPFKACATSCKRGRVDDQTHRMEQERLRQHSCVREYVPSILKKEEHRQRPTIVAMSSITPSFFFVELHAAKRISRYP